MELVAWIVSIIVGIILLRLFLMAVKHEAKKVFSRRGTFKEKKKKNKNKGVDDAPADTTGNKRKK
jgi:hypothetical protein